MKGDSREIEDQNTPASSLSPSTAAPRRSAEHHLSCHVVIWDADARFKALPLTIKLQSISHISTHMFEQESSQLQLGLSPLLPDTLSLPLDVPAPSQPNNAAVCAVSPLRELKGRRKRKFNKSLWTLQENLKYVEFVQDNMGLFDSSKENRRTIKINKLISQYVKTRSPDQCRSHHQKMLKYHHTIAGIIEHVAELQGLLEEEAEGQAKMPVRIRKKMMKAESEEAVTPVEISTPPAVKEEDALWDVLTVRWL